VRPVSVVFEDLTERQLRFGVLKIALSLAGVLAVGALIVSFFFQDNNKISTVPVYALLFAVAFSILSNGFLAILHIVDWFEKRRVSRDLNDG
jgi:O-antigen/teichoic acid export membrane protein